MAVQQPRAPQRATLDLREVVAAVGGLRADCEAVVVEATDPRSQPGTTCPEMVDRNPDFYDELFDVCTDIMLARCTRSRSR